MKDREQRIADLVAAGKLDAAEAARLRAAAESAPPGGRSESSSARSPRPDSAPARLGSPPAAAWEWIATFYWGCLLLAGLFLFDKRGDNIVLIKELVFVPGAFLGGLLSLVPALAAPRGPFPRRFLIGLAVAGGALVPATIATDAWFLTAPYLLLLAALGVMALSLAVVVRSPGQVWTMVGFLLGGGLAVSLYGLLQYFEIVTWGPGIPMVSTFGNPEFFGFFLVLLVPLPTVILLWSLGNLRRGSPGRKLALAAAMVPVLVSAGTALVLADVPLVLLALGAALVLTVALALTELAPQVAALGRGAAQPVAALVLTVLAGALLLGGYHLFAAQPVNFQSRSGIMNSPRTLTQWVFWNGALAMWRERPLVGFGPGTFPVAFPKFRHPSYHLYGVSHNTQHPNSEPLELLATTGLVGLAGALFLVCGLLVTVVGAYPRMPARFQVPFLALAGGGSGGLLTLLWTDHLRWAGQMIPCWFIIGILAAIAARREEETAAAAPRPTARRVLAGVVAVGLLGLAVASALAGVRQGTANRLMTRANAFAGSEDRTLREQGRDLYRRALASAPHHLSALYKLAYLQLRDEDPAGALASYRRLTALAPDYAQVHQNLRLVHQQLGQQEEMLAELELALARERSVALYAGAARTYASAGNPERARELRETALRIIDESRAYLAWMSEVEYLRNLAGRRYGNRPENLPQIRELDRQAAELEAALEGDTNGERAGTNQIFLPHVTVQLEGDTSGERIGADAGSR